MSEIGFRAWDKDDKMSREMTNREYIKRYFPPKVSKKILGYADNDFLQKENICAGSVERNRSNIVVWAFLWALTNEGSDYWIRIYEKLEEAGK